MRAMRAPWPTCLFATILTLTASFAGDVAEPKQIYFDWQVDNYAINQPRKHRPPLPFCFLSCCRLPRSRPRRSSRYPAMTI